MLLIVAQNSTFCIQVSLLSPSTSKIPLVIYIPLAVPMPSNGLYRIFVDNAKKLLGIRKAAGRNSGGLSAGTRDASLSKMHN